MNKHLAIVQSPNMSLPTDILFYISTYLSRGSLSITKELHQKYDTEYWYELRLKREYPELHLWCRTTYRDLYIKSLKMGNIYQTSSYDMVHRGESISNEPKLLPSYGTKAVIEGSTTYVLNFNGDLYKINGNDVSLKATQVVDIVPRSYITETKWYYNDIVIPIIPTSPFIKILSYPIQTPGTLILHALTHDCLYNYITHTKEIEVTPFDDAVDMYIDGGLFVLQSNHHLYVINYEEYKILIAQDIIRINGNTIISCTDDRNKIYYDTYQLSPVDCDKEIYIDGRMMRLDNGILSIESTESPGYTSHRIVSENVKDIFYGGNHSVLFYIK